MPGGAVMRVLVACEFSGVVRDAFLARGHDAISCDLLPTESPGPHTQGDVTPILREPWDLVIAFPPCTYLTKAAGNLLRVKLGWREKMQDAAQFFVACLNANAPRVAVENPRMYSDATKIVGRGPDTVIQPHMFGDPWVKTTGLWLKRLDSLIPDDPVEPTGRWVDVRSRTKKINGPYSAVRGVRGSRARSRTFPGIARAMAEQWGGVGARVVARERSPGACPAARL